MGALSYQSLVADKVHNIEIIKIILICFFISAAIGIIFSKKRLAFFMLAVALLYAYFLTPAFYSLLAINKSAYNFFAGIAALLKKHGLYILLGIGVSVVVYAAGALISSGIHKRPFYKQRTKGNRPRSLTHLPVARQLIRKTGRAAWDYETNDQGKPGSGYNPPDGRPMNAFSK